MINNQELDKARNLIYQLAGIHMPENKNSIIENRLEKLTKELKFDNFTNFLNQVESGQYKQQFINALTTNKTDFFREGFHFLDMMDRVLPREFKKEKGLKIYCAASSTGEEPYSIAATLLEAQKIYSYTFPLSIVATDIDTSVLEIARKGEYLVDTSLNPLPDWISLNDYFDIKSTEDNKIAMNAKEKLKKIITFGQHNLCKEKYPFNKNEFDIIFCRNVLIYFKVEDQSKILNRLFSHLKINGTLYLGHSESILDLSSKVERLGRNIFIKRMD